MDVLPLKECLLLKPQRCREKEFYVLNTLKDILSEGNEITFIGLGNFYIKKMDDKIIKAPNGKDYMSKKHSIIRFTASPVLNRKLNENINDD